MQIEKEMLAILFGCKHFYQYVYGRRFTVETDQIPLIFIMKKQLAAAPHHYKWLAKQSTRLFTVSQGILELSRRANCT